MSHGCKEDLCVDYNDPLLYALVKHVDSNLKQRFTKCIYYYANISIYVCVGGSGGGCGGMICL